MKRLHLKPNFALTALELELLNSLPTAAHDAKYSTPQQRSINGIFYRVFGTTQYADNLLVLAGKNKWPGGESKTALARQRDVLDGLKRLQGVTDNPPAIDAIELLLNTMLASNPLNIQLTGLVMEAADAEPPVSVAKELGDGNGV